MDETIREGYELIATGLRVARNIAEYMPSSREMALTITKIDEAILWLQNDQARAEGVTQHG
jgi:hypothetical protein